MDGKKISVCTVKLPITEFVSVRCHANSVVGCDIKEMELSMLARITKKSALRTFSASSIYTAMGVWFLAFVAIIKVGSEDQAPVELWKRACRT